MIDDRDEEPWTKVTLSRAEYEAAARADLAVKEAEARAQLEEIFARYRERLESDLLLMARDLAIQRGDVH